MEPPGGPQTKCCRRDARDSPARTSSRGTGRHLQHRGEREGFQPPDAEYLVSIIFGSDPSRTEELFGEVLEEIEWLRAGGEEEYLDKVKELLGTSREKQLRENGFWLSQIRAAVQRGESFTEIVGFEELLDALTLEDISAVAQRYFTDDRYVRVVLLPEEE